jgi:hypothetical protein
MVALIALGVDGALAVAQRVSTPKGLKTGQHVAKRRRFSLSNTARTES